MKRLPALLCTATNLQLDTNTNKLVGRQCALIPEYVSSAAVTLHLRNDLDFADAAALPSENCTILRPVACM